MAIYERTGNRRTDSSRINKIINQDLEEINKKYTEIGRIIKLRCLDQVSDSEVLTLASEVDAKLVELRELQEELNAVNGVKFCTKCNAKIDINVAFCPSCGAKQTSAVLPTAAPQPAQPVVVPPVQNVQPAPIPAPASAPVPAAPQFPEYSEATTYAGNDEYYDEAPKPMAFGESAPAPEPAPVIPAPAPAPAPQQQPRMSNVVFCTQCGSKEPAGTRFCSQCGSIIG